MTADIYAVQCNFREGTKVCPAGGRAYVIGVHDDAVWLLARSRGGRWVKKWERFRRVHNFRKKTITPKDPMHERMRMIGMGYTNPAWAEAEALELNKENP